MLQVVESPDGLDFQFGSKSAAHRFVDFVSARLPVRVKSSKQLVSHDPKNNTAFHKYTFSIDVCPVCKDDLVFLPRPIAHSVYGGISPFLLCSRIAAGVQLLDPFTMRGVDIACDKYWRHPFEPLLSRRHLTEFVVLDVEPVDMRTVTTAATASRFVKRQQQTSNAMTDDVPMNGQSGSGPLLADVEIARVSDFGVNDHRMTVRTHLGRVLRPGDTCLGYDLSTLNLAGANDALGLDSKVPYDVVLVRRAPRSTRRARAWLLQRLPVEKATGGASRRAGGDLDLEDFKRDLEEDSVMRQEVNLWKNPKYEGTGMAEEEDEEDAVKLCERLEGLTLEDPPDQYLFD